MNTKIQSRGLFSTWLHLPSISTLLDCGEGVAMNLRNRAYGVQKIFISHDHSDHISGLATLINTRNLEMGNNNVPLEIYHPKNTPNLKEFRRYIEKTQPRLKFPLHWHTLEPGKRIPVSKTLEMKPFKVEHGSADAYGFTIIEPRRRLKERFRHLGETELTRMRLDGVDLQETYLKKILTYSGDAWKVPKEEIDGTDYLFLDTTFLKNSDREADPETPEEQGSRKTPTHASLEENLEFLKGVKVHTLTCFHHLSPRYKAEDIEAAQKLLGPKQQIIPPGKNVVINPPQEKNPPKAPKPPAKKAPGPELEP